MAEVGTAERRFLTWTFARRIFILGAIIGLIVLLFVLLWFAALSRGVPSVDKLTQYEPPITSRVHAGDGSLIAEFANEHRVFVPYGSIPKHVVDAFVAAEDKTNPMPFSLAFSLCLLARDRERDSEIGRQRQR